MRHRRGEPGEGAPVPSGVGMSEHGEASVGAAQVTAGGVCRE